VRHLTCLLVIPRALYAFIDEAGQRSSSEHSSDHFVMSAVLVDEQHLPDAAAFLANLRTQLRRLPEQTLHWQNLKTHADRLHAAKSLGAQPWATISSVVVCKRHLTGELNDDRAYLYTLRFLLERMSWLARDRRRELNYTLAHIVRFKMETLREYEERLRNDPRCQVAWQAVSAHGGRLDQPSRVQLLQVADIAASATAVAFEPDVHGNTEQRYLQELTPRLYRRGTAPLTSYGLKMHPWSETTKTAYPWVAAL
jgi:hypothetical protein